MPNDNPIARSPSKTIWIVAYLISPAIPFLCLRQARAVGIGECICGIIAALLAHIGLVTVLSATNGDPLQVFVILLLGFSLYLIILWQFLAGRRAGIWTDAALEKWRKAGRFFAGFLAIALAFAIATFHLRCHLDPKHSLNPTKKPNKAQMATPRKLSD